jgi:hypothetical protein
MGKGEVWRVPWLVRAGVDACQEVVLLVRAADASQAYGRARLRLFEQGEVDVVRGYLAERVVRPTVAQELEADGVPSLFEVEAARLPQVVEVGR